MSIITKETPFNELPPNIKHKIINIRNAASNKLQLGSFPHLRNFSSLSVPSSSSLYEDFLRVHQSSHQLVESNVEEHLRHELAEFQKLASAWNDSINEKDFVAELERTTALLESRLDQIRKRRVK